VGGKIKVSPGVLSEVEIDHASGINIKITPHQSRKWTARWLKLRRWRSEMLGASVRG
jgi:hypothetical protein